MSYLTEEKIAEYKKTQQQIKKELREQRLKEEKSK